MLVLAREEGMLARVKEPMYGSLLCLLPVWLFVLLPLVMLFACCVVFLLWLVLFALPRPVSLQQAPVLLGWPFNRERLLLG